ENGTCSISPALVRDPSRCTWLGAPGSAPRCALPASRRLPDDATFIHPTSLTRPAPPVRLPLPRRSRGGLVQAGGAAPARGRFTLTGITAPTRRTGPGSGPARGDA